MRAWLLLFWFVGPLCFANPATVEIIEPQKLPWLEGVSIPRAEPLRWFVPAKSYWLVKHFQGKELFRHKVHQNEFGLRVTASDLRRKKTSRHLLFVGCSITMGQGVEDQQTFPYLLSETHQAYDTKNVGLRGAGISDQVYFWQHLPMRQLSPHEEGLMIVTLIPDHFARLSLSWRYLDWAFPFSTVYQFSATQSLFISLIEETWEYRWAQQVKRWGLSYWWLRLAHFHSQYRMRQALEEMPLALAELRRQYLRHYPKGRFVVTWMREDLVPEPEFSAFQQALRQLKMDFWAIEPDAARERLLKQKKWHIDKDGHPSAEAHRLYAKFLERKIQDPNPE